VGDVAESLIDVALGLCVLLHGGVIAQHDGQMAELPVGPAGETPLPAFDGDTTSDSFSIGIDGTGIFNDNHVEGVIA